MFQVWLRSQETEREADSSPSVVEWERAGLGVGGAVVLLAGLSTGY